MKILPKFTRVMVTGIILLALLWMPGVGTSMVSSNDEQFFNASAPAGQSAVGETHVYLPICIKSLICTGPLYSDDFSNPGSGWPTGDDGNVLMEYAYGEYRILVRPTEFEAGASPSVHAANYSVSVDVRNLSNAWATYGLAFSIDSNWDTFYSFEITYSQYYAIYRYDKTAVIMLTSNYSDALNPGTASNHIRIDRGGDSIKAYANGHLLASVTDGTYVGDRNLGLVVFSSSAAPNIDIRFDNFTVNSPGCGAATAALNASSPSSLQFALPSQFSRDMEDGLINKKY
jgi:hypothetical protein